MTRKKLPIVTLIGRTNVGKSTIFNKLTEGHGALVSKIPGTTRDTKSGMVLWLGRTFMLVDTAGLDVSTEKTIDKQAVKHASNAAKKSDVNILVVDVKNGLLPQDKEYAKLLQKLKIPYILAINKVDSKRQLAVVAEFERLGMGVPQIVSAVTGAGTGDLLDDIFDKLKGKLVPAEDPNELPKIRIAFVGKPNVGKSSLLNQIIGEERVIVSDIPNTTRDSQNITIEMENKGQKYSMTFVDTAGIRKRSKVKGDIAKISTEQSIRNIKRADVVLLMLDASESTTAQDKNISREILEEHKSLIIVVNKWDLLEDKDTNSDQRYIQYVHRSFPYLTWAPIVFISAKSGFKISRLISTIFKIHHDQTKEITDEKLAAFLKQAIKRQSPKKASGVKAPFIHTIKQIKTPPQTFKLVADEPQNLHFSYLRFLQNQLRERFDLPGVGIRIIKSRYKELRRNKK